MTGFATVLRQANKNRGFIICGLDPAKEKIPKIVTKQWGFSPTMLVVHFLTSVIDAVAPYVAGFKPNLAFFLKFDDWNVGKFHGTEALVIVCQYIRRHYPEHVLILDAKDGDIGASNDGYAARAAGLGAHAVTWNSYLGTAIINQMEKYPHLGFIVLARTSNPEGSRFQTETLADGRQVYEHNVDLWKELPDTRGQIGLVAGATFPTDLRKIRKQVGAMPLLVPGVGKQGGSISEVVQNGFGGKHGALAINITTDILYAGSDHHYTGDSKAAAQAAQSAGWRAVRG